MRAATAPRRRRRRRRRRSPRPRHCARDARRRACSAARRRRKRPNAVGPEPLTSAPRARRCSRSSASACCDRRARARRPPAGGRCPAAAGAARWRMSAISSTAPCSSARQQVEIASRQAQLVGARVDVGGARARRCRSAARTPGEPGGSSRSTRSPAPVTSCSARLELRRHVGAERHRERGQLARRRLDARRRAAPAAARRRRRRSRRRGPAATGIRFSIVIRSGGASPAEALAEAPPAPPRRGSAPARRGRRPRPRSPASLQQHARRRASRDWNSEQISCRPSVRRGADVEAEVQLRRRERDAAAASRAIAPAGAASSTNSSGASRSARSSAGWPISSSAARAAARTLFGRAERELERARERLAPVRERAAHEPTAPSGGRPARCGAGARAPSRRSARAGRRCARSAARARPRRRAGRSPTGRRRSCVPGARGEAVGDLALDHQAPEPDAPAAPRSSARSPARPRRREGSRRPCSARGSERRQVDVHHVAEHERRRSSWPPARRAAPARGAASVSTTCTCAHARSEVLAQDAEAAADLEHDVVVGKLGRAPDHVEDVVVDEEVLAELAVRADAEPRQPLEARARERGAHQLEDPARVRSTTDSSCS